MHIYYICYHFSDALKLYRGKLSAFEQTEILDYPEIWFLGLEAKKIEGVPGSAQNNGYDDENGSYIKVQYKDKSSSDINPFHSDGFSQTF